MTKATCSEPECPEEAFCRNLCRSHYGKARRKGELAPRLDVHSLSNVDPSARIADCTICGPRVPIGVRYRGTPVPRCECRMRKRKLDAERRGRGYRWPESQASRRARKIRKKYNISIADYDQMFAEQMGKCGICNEEFEQLSVDHDHTSGAVRGLLCSKCNIAIGLMFDRAEVAERAAVYLRTHGSPAM